MKKYFWGQALDPKTRNMNAFVVPIDDSRNIANIARGLYSLNWASSRKEAEDICGKIIEDLRSQGRYDPDLRPCSIPYDR